jgi:HSP20 family protein
VAPGPVIEEDAREGIEMTAQTATAMQTTKGSAPVRQSFEDLFDNIFSSITRRAFEFFEADGRGLGNDWDHWFRAESEILHPVRLDLKESDNDYTVRMEVPGFTPKDLEIKVEPHRVSIAGKRETKEEEKKGKTVRSELRSDQILRSIDLPADLDTTKVSATLKDGVLTIDLPKAPHAKAVRIEPRVA